MTARHDDDPLLRAIADANPVTDFPDVPALGPLPRRKSARRRLVPLTAATALATAAFAGVALTPTSTVGGREVLQRAFALQSPTEILHWRLKTHEPGLGFDFTDDVWLRIDARGEVDRVRELRLDGEYAGLESEIHQPNGLGDPTGASDRTRRSADGPVKEHKNYGYGILSFSSVISTALAAADGKLDVGAATEVRFRGRDAYEIRLKEATPPTPPSTRRSPPQVSVTMWLDRETSRPLAVRWGEGADLWRTVEVQTFERMEDNAANRRKLTLGG
jgi:hypothetical protein